MAEVVLRPEENNDLNLSSEADNIPSENGYIEQVEQGDVSGSNNDDTALVVSDDNTDDNNQIQKLDEFVLPKDAVVLPITQGGLNNGLVAQTKDSARWMAEWCKYMIKKYGERTFFRG